MKIITIAALFFVSIFSAFSQTGMLENFNDNILDPNWQSVPTGKFSFNESNGQLVVTPSSVGPGYENFAYSFSPVDLTGNPTVTIKIKNSTALTLRIDLVDINGNSTNAAPISKALAINGSLTTVTFDFTNKFTQSGGAIVDKTKIAKVVFFLNPGGTAYSTPITLDDVTVGDAIITTPGNIVLNQVGYELNGTKTAIFTYSANSLSPTTFDILSSANAVVYTGNIVSKGAVAGWTNRYFWELNFSAFQTPGIYKIRVGTKISYPFEIGQNILFTKTAFSVVDFFTGMRSTNNADKTLSFNGPRDDQVNVYGGWRDATGDPGKHMSHLSYADYFNPQQIPFVVWSLLKSYEMSQASFAAKSTDLLNESKWGADYLLRNIDKQQNYLYLSIFDDWGNNPSSREICEWGQPGAGNDGARTPNYQAAMREGAGMAIAALARAYRMNLNGDSTKAQYLNGAIRLYTNLKAVGNGYATKNLEYCNDHTENMIDFYCGLLATVELYKATNNAAYLTDASAYANKIISMQDPQGFFKSDVAGTRPFYHAADEGMPLVSLMEYMDINPSQNTTITQVLKNNITWYMGISKEVNNPFNYMREYCTPNVNGVLGTPKKAFFLPHDNETGYWWQGENARLASMSTALLLAGRRLNGQFTMGTDSLSTFGLAQLDWILGKNPFDVCMMTGAGTTTYQNYPVSTAIPNVTGGICNGITCKDLEETNIDWMPFASSDWNNWRWIEQWLPHDAWFLLALSSVDVMNTQPPAPPVASFTSGVSSVCSGTTTTLTNTSTGSITSYSWNFGTDASIATATTAGPFTISWSSAGVKTISLTVTGPGGTSTKTSTVTVTTVPTAAGTITGVASTCANSTAIAYSIPAITTATGYTWTLPTGASITAGTNTNAITVSFATTGGTIQVTPTNTCGNGTPATKTVAITTVPTAAGTITGVVSTCANSTGITYSIPAITSATGYTWSLPTGASITAGTNTNAITVSFATTGGTIQVTPTNTCGNGTVSSTTVAITTVPPAAGTITGVASTCANSTGITYSIPAITSATGYTWTLPTGASITAGTNTNAITVSFASTGGAIQVTPTNTCGNGTSASKTVTLTTVPAAAGTITGVTSTCASSSGISYSIPAVTKATSYTWSLPSDASITAGANTNAITVSFGVTGGTIQVTPVNTCGNGTASSMTVAITTVPPAAGTITGVASTCANSTGVTYSIPSITTATTYTWGLPVGSSITAGANTNAITVSFATTGGTIQVTPGNTCGNGNSASLPISITTVPAAAGTITESASSACANSPDITYSISAVSDATGYTWTLPTNASITSGINTNSITVTFASTGGTVQVTPVNTCGNGQSSSIGIEIIPIGSSPCFLPVTSSISGPGSVAAGEQNVTYSVSGTAGSTYNWTVPAGATIISGQGTNTIVVSFGNAGGNVSVQETNSYGTGSVVSKTIGITVTTGIVTTSDYTFSMYPNPTNEYSIVTFENTQIETAQLSIIDMKGVVLYSAESSTHNELTIGNELAAGIYIVQIKVGDNTITKRLIKM